MTNKLLTFLLVSSFVMTTVSEATVIKDLEFDVDGVLPSADPEIVLFNNSGAEETTLYSVSQGFLRQRTKQQNGSMMYQCLSDSPPAGKLDPNSSTIVETRLRILDINGRFGAFLAVFDGIHCFGIDFDATHMHVSNWWGAGGTPATTVASLPVNVFGTHTYRLEFDAAREMLDVFIDGSREASVSVPACAFQANGFEFGDGTTALGNGADVDWDYVRVAQIEPVPTLSTWAVVTVVVTLLGVGVLLLYRRRHSPRLLHE